MTETIELDPRDPTMDEPDDIEIPVVDDGDVEARRRGFVNAAAWQWYEEQVNVFGVEHGILLRVFVSATIAELANLRERVTALEQAKGKE